MERALIQLRRKYTLSTTILSGLILLMLFSAFFGMLVLSLSATSSMTLELLLENPNDAVPVADDMGRACFVFYLTSSGSAVPTNSSYARIYNSYSDSEKAAIQDAIADLSFENSSIIIKYDNLHFRIRSADVNSTTYYSVVDVTSDYRTMSSIGILLAILYLVALLVSALASFLFSFRALAPVAEAFRKQRDLIANASHELKTPLTVISTNMSVMKSEPNSTVADNAKWIDAIDAQIQRMNRLIINMLQLSMIEHRSIPMSEINLSEITERACLAFDGICFEKGVSFVSNVQPDICIMGERDSIDRLITCLLDNATKYCGEQGKIGVILSRDKKNARLVVINSGEVISKEEAKNVFNRFYRSDGARSNQSGNSFGLGLAIAQATVIAHDGTITCRGVENKGTIFEVLLPIAKPERKKQKLLPPKDSSTS